jgi:hypothetical protein
MWLCSQLPRKEKELYVNMEAPHNTFFRTISIGKWLGQGEIRCRRDMKEDTVCVLPEQPPENARRYMYSNVRHNARAGQCNDKSL